MTEEDFAEVDKEFNEKKKKLEVELKRQERINELKELEKKIKKEKNKRRVSLIKIIKGEY